MHIARVNYMREDKCCWVGTHALSGSRFGSRTSFCGTGVIVFGAFSCFPTQNQNKKSVGKKFCGRVK